MRLRSCAVVARSSSPRHGKRIHFFFNFYRYKEILNEALLHSKVVPKRCIIYQRRNVEECSLETGLDVLWDDALEMTDPHPCVPVEANDPLYILYTSGTTGKCLKL